MTLCLCLACPALQSWAQTELIQNGGFELGGTGWTMGGGAAADNSAGFARTGSFYAWLGGVPDEVDYCYQQITIPAGATAASLSFYYNVVSDDDPFQVFDTFSATIRDSGNAILATVVNLSNVDGDAGAGPTYYHLQTFDLMAYAGQTIRIYFSSANDSSLQTSFDIDDVSVQVVTGGGGNHPPVANPQTVSVNENSTLPITLTATDADSDPLTYSIVTQPSNGTLSGTPPNVTYHPNVNFSGSDTFTFKANDGHVDSTPATISITVNPPVGLVIIPTWDSTITSDPNASGIEATINAAIQAYESKFSDPVTVNIKFAEMSSGLGQSSTYLNTIPYSTFYNALVADSKTTNDTIALAHIPGGSVDPVDGTSSIRVTTANQRALGINANPPAGAPDSTISLNMSIININRAGINASKYDLMAVVSHEIDEALGTASGLTRPNSAPVDLFRYNSLGARSYTISGDDAWFSIDGGTTRLVQYNQDSGGDYGDWKSNSGFVHTPRVQDAFGTPGSTPNLGVELTVLDVIGWDLITTTPAPTIQSVTRSGSTLSFSWAAGAGKSYQLQYKTDLTQATWQNLGSVILASGSTAGTSDSIAADPRRFYRIALLPTPSSPRPSEQPQVGPFGPPILETRYLLPEQAEAMKAGRLPDSITQ